MYTAVVQVIIYQLTKYEKDPIMTEKSQNADSRKVIKGKRKTIQQQKGLPFLWADLNNFNYTYLYIYLLFLKTKKTIT